MFIAHLSKPVRHRTPRVILKADYDVCQIGHVYIGLSVHEVRSALAEDAVGRGLSVPVWQKGEAGNFLLSFP